MQRVRRERRATRPMPDTLPKANLSPFMEIPQNKSEPSSNGGSQRCDGHAETGKINDELRYAIIDAVYMRPAIWDHGREPKSLGQRKDHFIEIAALLSTEANVLSCYDIEKQWKNLKDTYYKTKKKLVTDESGCVVPPKWKFFSVMMFLDQLNCAPSSAGHVGPEQSGSILGKRPIDPKPPHRTPEQPQSHTTCLAEPFRSPPTPGTKPSVDQCSFPNDEYTVFCNSLIYPLREIGSINRVELLKLQKEIRDAVHAKQMSLLQGERQ